MKHGAGYVVALALVLISFSGRNSQASSEVSQSAEPDRKQTRVSIGKWGGTHLQMEITAQGAALDFDCADGAITEPIVLDASGKFRARGIFHPQHGGPVRRDETLRSIEVVYSGSVHGDTMELEFTLDNGSPEKFTLVRGKDGRLMRCA